MTARPDGLRFAEFFFDDDVYDAWDRVLADRGHHEVRWTITPDSVRGALVCHGGQTAGCHAYCADGCESYPCEHPPTFGRGCGVLDWFEDSTECYYAGPETAIHDGPIEIQWTGEGYEWTYSETER
jgi:hypothetical protein